MMYCCTSCTGNRLQELQPTIESLYDVVEGFIDVNPDLPDIYVIFFKASQHDVQRALVTRFEHKYSDGYLWSDYYFKDGKWQKGASTIFADKNEFFVLSEKRQRPKFIFYHVGFARDEYVHRAHHITTNSRGN